MPRVLYIAGAPRSGSTIIGNLLGEAPDAVSVGELSYVWDKGVVDGRKCGCGVPVPECPFWTRVLERFEDLGRLAPSMARQRDLHLRTRKLVSLRQASKRGAPPTMAGFVDSVRDLYTQIAAVSEAAIIVDSSKSPMYGAALRHFVGLDVYTLHLLRDPRAVAYSWLRPKVQLDRHSPGLLRPIRPSHVAATWVTWNRAVPFLGLTDEPYRQLRYEDFVENPAEQMESILAWVGSSNSRPVVEIGRASCRERG